MELAEAHTTRVLWLTRYGYEGASSRYRVLQFIEPLRHANVTSTVHPLAHWQSSRRRAVGTVAGRLADLVKPPAVDVVVIQKDPVMPAALWPAARRLVSRLGQPLIWDVDDAIWVNSPAHGRMARDMARSSTHVVAGNELIAEWARANGARSVTIIPTCFTPAALPIAAARNASRRMQIVWVGTPSTARTLEHEADRLRAIASVPNVQVTFIGGEPPAQVKALPNVEVLDWSREAEHRLLSSADFGLALQPRTEFADHKCGFKIIQYMAYGVVPIATDNPVHRRILNGLGRLVGANVTGEELAEIVAHGVAAPDRDAVRDRWSEHYSTAVGADAWGRLLREVGS